MKGGRKESMLLVGELSLTADSALVDSCCFLLKEAGAADDSAEAILACCSAMASKPFWADTSLSDRASS